MWMWINELLNRRDYELERRRSHELDLKVCNACETLKEELARAHSREKELITIIKGTVKEPEEHKPFESKVELPNLRKPWAVKRQELERASRNPKNRPTVTPDNLDDEIELVRDDAH